MSNSLYRQEALDHQNRRLFGEVLLSSPPAVWWITLLLLAVLIVGGALLFFVNVETAEGSRRLIDWIIESR